MASFLDALDSDLVSWAYFVRLELDEVDLALTTMQRDVTVGGVEYLSIGAIGTVSDSHENDQLEPEQMTIGLSGIDPTVVAATINANYYNRRASVLVAALDDQDQIIGDPHLMFRGYIESMQLSYGLSGEIRIDITDEIVDWSRERNERYTDQSQRAKYPGDTGFRFVAGLEKKTVIWPARNWFKENA